mmetsp:Transcript_6731/g.13492  ORF Transcript_6731/g.13492 Transcript_6731/m.13492 type:complete len:795 (+) Transcript_6731:207-2591(+)
MKLEKSLLLHNILVLLISSQSKAASVPSSVSSILQNSPECRVESSSSPSCTPPLPKIVLQEKDNVPENHVQSKEYHSFHPKKDLQPGRVEPITLKHAQGEKILENSFQVRLPEELSTELLNYCKDLGLLEILQDLLYDHSDPLPKGEEEDEGDETLDEAFFLQGKDGTTKWFAQKPAKNTWNSEMYWISPAEEFTHEKFLSVLGRGRLDDVLEGMGKSLGLKEDVDDEGGQGNGLAVYQMSWVVVTSSWDDGYVHYDVTGTDGGAWNLIIPLLFNHDDDGKHDEVSLPGLLLVDDYDEERVERWEQSLHHGILIGDDVMYTMGDFDYRPRNGMHLAVSIYIADIKESNVHAIMDGTLAQIFPLPDSEWFMAQAGRHWSDTDGEEVSLANDQGRKAYRFDDWFDDCEKYARDGLCELDIKETRPNCLKSCNIYIEEGPYHTELVDETHFRICVHNRTGGAHCQIHEDVPSQGDFVTPPLQVGEMFPIVWRDSGKRPADYAFQIRLPPALTTELLAYSDRVGITDLFRSLLGSDPIEPKEEHSGKILTLNDGNIWYAQRPAKRWQSNMHWVSPADEKTHEDYLKVLASGDFDSVLDSIGRYLGLKGLAAYHLTFIGVSHSVKGFVHHDFDETGASVYNVIIPLILDEGADPELIITDSRDGDRVGGLKYQVGYAGMMGDGALHGTEACDYRQSGGMRLAATVYIADINEGNANAIADQTLTQIFPLQDTKWLMAQAGRHWGGENRLVGDRGREWFDFEDEKEDCEERARIGLCESDADGSTRSECQKTCGVYITMM